MIRNVGDAERILRILFGVFALVFVINGYVSGVILVVLVLAGTGALFSGIYGACPIYHRLKISTFRKQTKS